MSNIPSRTKELQPKRMEYALMKFDELGIRLTDQDDTQIQFMYKGNTITFFPYTGWHSGKGIKDGRGLTKLLKQLV